MVLLLAVAAGLLAAQVRATSRGGSLASLHVHADWLVPLAFLPQGIAFYLPATRRTVSDGLASIALVSSQFLLLAFVWFNRHQPGFWALGIGVGLNLLAILLNGGLMPISPETVVRLAPGAPVDGWQVGSRLGMSKNVLLPASATQLAWLSDCLLLPNWFPFRAAVSLGDLLIAAGAFGFLWELGGNKCQRLSTYVKLQSPASG